jgi:hypothetical protein
VAELVSAVRYVHDAGYGESMKDLTILVGAPEGVEIEGAVVVIGECSAVYEESGPMALGCPPAEDDVLTVICDAIGADASLVMTVRDENRRRMWDATSENVKG